MSKNTTPEELAAVGITKLETNPDVINARAPDENIDDIIEGVLPREVAEVISNKDEKKTNYSVHVCKNVEWICVLKEKDRYSQYLTDSRGKMISPEFSGPKAPWEYKKQTYESFIKVLKNQPGLPELNIESYMLEAVNDLKDQITAMNIARSMFPEDDKLSVREVRANEIRRIAEDFMNKYILYPDDDKSLFNCDGYNYVKFRRGKIKEIEGEEHFVPGPYTIMNLNSGRPGSSSKFTVYLKEIVEINYGIQITSGEVNDIIDYLMRYSLANEQTMHRRIAQIDNTIYYDLCDKDNNVIIIKDGNWEKVEDNEEIIFIREKHQLPQIDPIQGGNYDKLRRFLPFKNEDDKTLYQIKISANFNALESVNRHHVILDGPANSGKTATSKAEQDLVDPNTTPEGDPIDDNIDVQTVIFRASKRPIAAFDNSSTIKKPISNVLCQFSTGYSAGQRKFFVQDEEILRNFKSSVIITTTGLSPMLEDLKSRTIKFECSIDQDSKKWKDDDYKREWKEELPEIFGGLLDIVAKIQEVVKDLKLDLPQYVRMTDFAKWTYAYGEVTGIGGKETLDMYLKKLTEGNLDILTETQTAQVIWDYLKTLPQNQPLKKTSTEFYESVSAFAQARNQLDAYWPNSSSAFIKKINALINPLHIVGILIETGKRTSKGTIVTITNKNPAEKSDIPLIFADGTSSSEIPGIILSTKKHVPPPTDTEGGILGNNKVPKINNND